MFDLKISHWALARDSCRNRTLAGATHSYALFGRSAVSLEEMFDATAEWQRRGGYDTLRLHPLITNLVCFAIAAHTLPEIAVVTTSLACLRYWIHTRCLSRQLQTKVIAMFESFRSHGLLLSITFIAGAGVGHAGDGQLRIAKDDAELRGWLENMVWHHRYSVAEMEQVTGLDASQLKARLREFRISDANRPPRAADRLLLLPYPGGRHPRIGFLDGAVEPQRETKLSVFCPWDDHSYVVMDVPEAIWSNLGLTYLAHTHVRTIWDLQGTLLEQQEWQHTDDGSFQMQRRLPNGIEFGITAKAMSDHIAMTMFLKNGTDEPLSDLRVQNCVMLKGAEGFDQQTNDNKKFADGYAVAGSIEGTRWIITGWDPIHRAWGNAPCPCLHSDPKFPDCDPGETQHLRGWLSFYQGTDIDTELKRIDATGWRQPKAGAKE